MNTNLNALLLFGAVVGLYAPQTAVAQKTAGGVVGEARLHPGTWNNQRSSRSGMRSRPMYRSSESVIVRSEPAPSRVAETPNERRSYSYEPSQRTEQRSYSYEPSQRTRSGGCGCGGSVSTEPVPATAQRSTESGRSFSYEPSIGSDAAQPRARSYSTPRMESSRSSRRPAYLLPKTDPNKYRPSR
jgi:hypothetical protein